MDCQLRQWGMEYHDFSYSRPGNIVMALRKGPEMEVADRAARKSSKLEMNVTFEIRHLHHLARNCHQIALVHESARVHSWFRSASLSRKPAYRLEPRPLSRAS